MDRAKTAALNAADQLALAKTSLRSSAAAFAPLNPIRHHPLMSVGLALGTGLALSNMPRTRRGLVLALDRGLSWLINLAVPSSRPTRAKASGPSLPTNPESQGTP